ncbi:MAG: DNA-directed RNA polymerase sigma-70 factor [Ardenticatenaceae bacterium]|nr:MAG: DNA-directed RNA polymerase sigma-70 factor [Ardenticatenaceae bacterium]
MREQEQKRIFDEWLDTHKGLFFKVVRAYAFTPQDQEDLFQEIALQVWDSVPNFRNESSVPTWIYRVALYTAMSWARREIKHDDGKRPLSTIAHTLIAIPTQQDERLIWLYDQIAQLNEIDRSLTLLLLDGYSYKEMATILGISVSNVGVKINRIKKHLTRKSKEGVKNGV